MYVAENCPDAQGAGAAAIASGTGEVHSQLMKKPIFALLAALAVALPALGQAAASTRVPTLAIIDIVNAGMDPRVDYLASMVQGLLAFDLGSKGDITLVDRRNLDAVLKEKELSLSAIGADADSAAAAGRLAGADWLLSGEYVFMGTDVLITLSLTDTATAKRVVFRDRGSSENLVHGLAEQVALRLTGKQAAFADPSRTRSLVSLRDETPGSIALFSPIIRAEVYLDEQFIGYTTGDSTVPYIMDKLSPGQHRVRVHLDPSFGVVKLPEVTFHDWDVAVDIEPGKRATLRDQTRQLNYYLYSLIRIDSGSARSQDTESKPGAPAPKLAFSKEFAFQDRKGVDIAVKMDAKPRMAGANLSLDFTLSVGPKGQAPVVSSFTVALPGADTGEKEGETEAGIVKLSADLTRGDGYWSLDWYVERTDIRQSMWTE
jgi:hypothetical protein